MSISKNTPELWRENLPKPAEDGHKYDRGHCAVLSGAPSATGAARLAAMAALRIGSGLVTVVSPGSALLVNAAQLTAIMVKRADDAGEITDMLERSKANAVIAGPGLGTGKQTRTKVLALAGTRHGLVLDADALTSFSEEPGALFDALSGRERTVLTPHDGEFARLFPDVAGAKRDKAEKASEAARQSGAIVVLKGPETIIADPFGWTIINDHASPWLATAGSGDVLAGMIAGLMAQGMTPMDAACAGVWMHGDAGMRGGAGLVADDLPGLLPRVLAPFFEASR